MSQNNLHDAVRVEELEAERDRLAEQLKGMEKIRIRMAQLETIIKTWKDVVEEQQPETSQEKLLLDLPEVNLEASLTEMPHAEGISLILKEAGRLLNVSEIESEFRKRKWKLSEENGSELLRRVLRKREDLFIGRRRDKGLTIYYGLKKN